MKYRDGHRKARINTYSTEDSDNTKENSCSSIPSFDQLFRENHDFVKSTVLRLGVPRSDADDLTQTSFLTIHRRIHTYDSSRPLRPWLYGVVFRVVSDYRRLARHRREVHTTHQDIHDNSLSPERKLEQAESKALVCKGLRGIKGSRREVFVLYELEELPMREVAKSMSIPLFTAYSRLRKARNEFASQVRQQLATGTAQNLAAA